MAKSREPSHQEVLAKLDSIVGQLDGVTKSQVKVETALRRIHQDICSATNPPFVPATVPAPLGSPGGFSLGVSNRTSFDANRQQSLLTGTSSVSVLRQVSGPAAEHVSDEGASKIVNASRIPRVLTFDTQASHPLQAASPHVSAVPSLADDDSTEGRVGAGDHDLGFWLRKEFACSSSKSNVVRTDFSLVFTRGSTLEGRHFLFRPIHPDSWKRACFDFLSMGMLLFDSIMVPYQFAWRLPFKGWVASSAWVTLGFWIVDLLLGFATGFHKSDAVEMDMKAICLHYLKGGFFPNLVVVLADLFGNMYELTLGDQGGGPYAIQRELVKLARFIKLNRVWLLTSIVRTGKVAEAVDWLATNMRQWGVHEQFNFMCRVSKLVFYIIWVNHLGGCLWHMVGTEAKKRWYGDFRRGQTPDEDGDLFDYMLGFYWSASSMIAGSSIMVPRTPEELVMTVFCVVFGFIFSSVLISSLLTTVMEYQEANKEQYHKIQNLRQYLYQHGIDSKLAMPIVKQAHAAMQRRKHLAEGDVEALTLISPMMRSELWYHLYKPRLMEKPFFCVLNVMSPGFIKDICTNALKHRTEPPGSLVFSPDEEAIGAYYVYNGEVDYIPAGTAHGVLEFEQDFSHWKSAGARKSSDLASVKSSTTASTKWSGITTNSAGSGATKGTWISEASLWVHWLHRGWLDARTPCEIMTVEAKSFVKLVGAHPEALDLVRKYSNVLYKAMKDEAVLNDLHVVPHHSVVAAMEVPDRIEMSQAALDVLDKLAWSGLMLQTTGLAALKNEIEEGKSDLTISGDNEVRRILAIAALHLTRRSDGQMLCEIGKVKEGSRMAKCQTPGTKTRKGEIPKAAVDRMISEKMAVLRGEVKIGFPVSDSEERASRSFGIRSFYMRTLYEAELMDEPDDYAEGLPRIRCDVRVQQASMWKATLNTINPEKISKLVEFGMEHGDPTQSLEAFVFRETNMDTTFIFAWMPPEDFTFLSSPSGEPYLKKWVDELDLSCLGITDLSSPRTTQRSQV